ncbi:amino acid aminotransferase, putative [Citrifermentans bemidjiense Bem]|uniref:Aminotransferase n=1 Tax=Citrifermentans bemidjiense (strain ATCC BAA-1014 / DSM 16622 / JCM 12645 / Bem) TaxID=404380 RepID=B5E8D3_CITBB|nr:aminotransferase [Citrifermentans bemidjiense]ACH37116.1 amino acid aminotransferase, putative [Citrifermentans bemidjiense Bem]
MRFPVSPLIAGVHPPPISEVKSWIAGAPAGLPLIDLCQAIPDYPPPRELTDHLAEVMLDPHTSRYSIDEGLPEVREAICGGYRELYGACIDPSQLILTIGASQAFWLAMVTLCRAGDEVIVQLPAYFDHPMALEVLGIRCVYAPFEEARGGLPSVAAIASLITEKTRAILLVTPSNPTGAVISPETVRELHRLAVSRDIALVLDETYNSFITGGVRPHDLFQEPNWGDHFVHIASFGKTFALTGYRAGMLAASEEFIRHALKAQDTMAVCQPRVAQHAVKYGFERLSGWVAENRVMMERRHEVFRAEFEKPGNAFKLVASGPFFGWVRHPLPKATGREVARRLVEEAGILLLPGEVFGPGLEGYLRLAFGNIREETIPEAVARFREFNP